MRPGVRGGGLVSVQSWQHSPLNSLGALSRRAISASSTQPTPQKALRGVIPASLCLVLGAILWEIVVKS